MLPNGQSEASREPPRPTIVNGLAMASLLVALDDVGVASTGGTGVVTGVA
jgi:hypothetical protein